MLENPSKIKDFFKTFGKTKDSFIESYVAREKYKMSENDFFVVLEILNDEVDGDEIADALVETFRKHFYEDSNLNDYARFEEALKYVNDVARDLQSNGLPLFQLNVAIAALCEDTLYVTQANDAEVYLLRSGSFSNISEGLSVGKRKEHSDLFENIATGVLEKDDMVLFSTARLIRYLPQNELSRQFHSKDLENGFELLADRIEADVLGRIGVLGLNVVNALVEEEEVLPKQKFDFKNFSWKDRLKFGWLKVKDGSRLARPFWKELKLFVGNFLSGKKVNWRELRYGKFILGILVVFLVWVALIPTGVLSSAEKKESLVLLEEASELIASAKSEVDRERSFQLVTAAEAKINQVSVKSLKSEVEDLRLELLEVTEKVDNLVSLTDLSVYADISAKRSNADLIGMQRYLNNYYAFDSSRLYEFIGDLVKDPVNLLDQGSVKAGVFFEDVESLVFLTADNKIREFGSGVVKFMDTEDAVFKPGRTIATYGSRLYLLDNVTGQVWKYQRKRDSYGKAEPALDNIDNEKVKKAVSLAIDGSVYLLYADGEIEKYYAGSLVTDFVVETKPLTSISSASYIYTDLDFPYVLILETASKKIFQFVKDSKTGNLVYRRQYYFADLNTVTGFIADVASKRLLVSDKNKIYVTELLN